MACAAASSLDPRERCRQGGDRLTPARGGGSLFYDMASRKRPSTPAEADEPAILLEGRLPVEALRIERARPVDCEVVEGAAAHVHAFLRRPYPEDYAGDCACGEAARSFDGQWDVSPSYRRNGAPTAAPNARGNAHENVDVIK